MGLGLLFGLLSNLTFGQDPAINEGLAIVSIAAQGTNLELRATVPDGLGRVALEVRPALDAPWQAVELANVMPSGGEFVFTIPKPADMQFFRLRARSNVASGGVVSAELNYVTIPALGADPENIARDKARSAEPGAVFHFKGLIDGSDRILTTRVGALWEHAHWGWPEGAVIVNRTRWDPRQKNYLTTAGTEQFLPEGFSIQAVDLERIKGRDVIALERTNNALIVYLDDTPGGAGEYEFKIHFHSARTKPTPTRASTAASLKIAAEIDGSDCVRITSTEATWEHKRWGGPADVRLNDQCWSIQQTNVMPNAGINRFLPAGVDLSTARIISRKGRDLATMWADEQALLVWFADNPNGSDHYELEIGFGQ